MKNLIVCAIVICGLLAGCASSTKEMSAKDEARYAAAIEKAEAEHPSAIPEGSTYVVAVGEAAALDVQAQNASDMPTIERPFSVPRAEYQAFFAQSPAVVLARMTLDPITDGGKLLGYRVKDLKPFTGVDLANEDIIVGIDGVLPQNPVEYFNSWENAKSSNGCKVNVQRGMDQFDLVWSVSD